MKRLALLGFLLIAACASVGGGNSAHAITLSYKSGDTYKYHFHGLLNYTVGIQGTTIPVNVDLAADEKMTVKSVDSSGIADINVDLTNLVVKTTANGTTNTTNTSTTTSIEMKIGPDGHVVSINGNAIQGSVGVPGISGSQGGLLSAILPDKPVKVGDTWTKDFDENAPLGSGTIHVSSTNKYTKDEKVGSVNTSVVDSNITTTINLKVDSTTQGGTDLFPTGGSSGMTGFSMNGTDTATVTSWVDTGAKRIVKTHQTDTVDATLNFTTAAGATPNPFLSGPLTLKGTQTLDMTPA